MEEVEEEEVGEGEEEEVDASGLTQLAETLFQNQVMKILIAFLMN